MCVRKCCKAFLNKVGANFHVGYADPLAMRALLRLAFRMYLAWLLNVRSFVFGQQQKVAIEQ